MIVTCDAHAGEHEHKPGQIYGMDACVAWTQQVDFTNREEVERWLSS